MYNVSRRYKDGMKRDLRERSYIRVNFGIVNREAQSSATIDWANTSTAETYSNSGYIFSNGNDDIDYATFEQDFTKLDGSSYFYSWGGDVDKYVSKEFVSEQNPVKVTVNLNVATPQEIKGLTISFGDLYPVKFDVINVTTGDTIISVTDNTSATWITEEVLSNISSIRFVFYEMKSSPARLRINYILFGLGKTYDNDTIVESSLEESLSPINENLPQYDFSMQLDNYPNEDGVRYFDVDNPSSTINYLKKGQEIDVWYGYELPTDPEEDDESTVEELAENSSGEIEWMKGGHFYLSEWESNDTTATIKATDVLRNKEDTYDKGVYSSSGTTYYDLCVSVLADMGITNYELSDILKKFKTTTPIPKVTHKEVLQLIANACGCTVTVDRDGKVFVGLSTNDKNGYTTLSTSNVTKNGTEYVSNNSSDSQGNLSNPPTFTYTFSKRLNLVGDKTQYYDKGTVSSIEFQFGDNLPSEIKVTSTSGVNITVKEGIDTNTIIPLNIGYKELSDLTIVFTKTQQPNQKLSVKKIQPSNKVDFKMDKTDISENVTVTKLNTLQNVTISFAKYIPSTTAEEVGTEDISDFSTEWRTTTFTFDEPYAKFSANVTYRETSGEDEKNTVLQGCTQIINQGAYFVEIKYTQYMDSCGAHYGDTLRIYGYKLNKTDYTHTITYNDTGDVISWENPLIDNRDQVRIMATVIGNYYEDDMEYNYSTRGNPELDVNDIVYQENDYHDNMNVRIINYTTSFNGSFSGSVTARREV